MAMMDRREFFRTVVGSTALAAAGATASMMLVTDMVEAAPFPMDKQLPQLPDDLVQDAQVVIVKPGRRRRVRRCWWHRGRRICGWR